MTNVRSCLQFILIFSKWNCNPFRNNLCASSIPSKSVRDKKKTKIAFVCRREISSRRHLVTELNSSEDHFLCLGTDDSNKKTLILLRRKKNLKPFSNTSDNCFIIPSIYFAHGISAFRKSSSIQYGVSSCTSERHCLCRRMTYHNKPTT